MLVSKGRRPPFAYLPVAISALCAVLALQMAWKDPRYLLAFVAVALLAFAPPLLARQRMRKLMISGDVKRLLGTWEPSMARVMFPETMGPLMMATAYAAYGWVDAARTALARAVRGPAWEAALEQRLFVEALLDTFEGEKSKALEKAEALARLPVPVAGLFTRLRITRLRRGTLALVHAFAHRAGPAEATLLRRAGASSPLIHWAMRYGAAVAAVDRGDSAAARVLLQGAPAWPEESAFSSFHDELLSQVALLGA